jgi:quercetin dioxygenase-like cupin family protein
LEKILIVRQLIVISVLLILAVWVGYPLICSPVASPSKVAYDVRTKSSYGGKDFIIRDTKIEPGGSIGWHWHQGTVFAVVKEGTLHHYRKDCTVDAVYRPGDSFLELRGADNVHDGRNFGAVPVVLEVFYIVPEGTPVADIVTPPSKCREGSPALGTGRTG